MPLYRKRPVVVNAEQWLGHKETPMECVRPVPWATPDDEDTRGMTGPSTDGVPVFPRDWIITGASGGHSVCTPKEFAATYEPASTAPCNERLVKACNEMALALAVLRDQHPDAGCRADADRLVEQAQAAIKEATP